MRLTKTAIDGLELLTNGQAFYWDDTLPGFGVRVSRTTKTYVAQGRVNGKARRVSLGRHGVITCDQARRKAQKALAAMAEGIDLVATKKAEKALSVTLGQVVEDYLDDRSLKPLTASDIRRHLQTTFSAWIDEPVAKISRDMVRRQFKKKAEKSPAQANQAFRYLRAIINYARATYRPDDKPLILENPVSVLSESKMWRHIKPRTGKVPTDRVGAFWHWLQALRRAPDQTTESRSAADALCFMLLTGVRKGEALPLKWADADLEGGFFRLTDTKNGNDVTLPLSTILIKILEQRPRINEYVFPGRGPGHLTVVRRTLLRATDVVGCPVTAHDLRRTFRAIAGTSGVEFWRTKLLMNHKPGADVTLQSYTELSDLRYLRADAEKIARFVVQQGSIERAPKVVNLSARRLAK